MSTNRGANDDGGTEVHSPAVTDGDLPTYMSTEEAENLLSDGLSALLGIDEGDTDQDESQSDDDDDEGDQGESQSDEDDEENEDDEDEAEDDADQDDDQSDDEAADSGSGLFVRDEKGKLKPVKPEEVELELTIDGEPETLSVAELRDGFMRTRDYTRKTQQIAQRVADEVRSGVAEAQAKLDKRAGEIDLIVDYFTREVKEAPSFQDLLAKRGGDAVAASRDFDSINALRSNLEAARKAQAERNERQAAEQQQAMASRAEKTVEILRGTVEGWKDDAKFKQDEQRITRYLAQHEVTQAELVGILQHPKFGMMLLDAANGADQRKRKTEVKAKRQSAKKRTQPTSTAKKSTEQRSRRVDLRTRARRGDQEASEKLIETLI